MSSQIRRSTESSYQNAVAFDVAAIQAMAFPAEQAADTSSPKSENCWVGSDDLLRC